MLVLKMDVIYTLSKPILKMDVIYTLSNLFIFLYFNKINADIVQKLNFAFKRQIKAKLGQVECKRQQAEYRKQ